VSTLEAILRDINAGIGGSPELWRGLLPVVEVALSAFDKHLPSEVVEPLRQLLGPETSP
jgi:hypothetical protein